MKNSPILRLHLIVFLWGFTAIVGKLISIEALGLVFYRMLFASIILWFFIRCIKKESLKVSKQVFKMLFGVGVLIAIHWVCFFHSIKVSNVSIALCCLSLSTLFAAFVEPLFFKRKIDWLEILIGCVIVACIGVIFNIEFKYKEGIFYGILAAFFGTLFSVFNGKLFGKTASHNIIFYELVCGCAAVGIFLLLSGQQEVFTHLPMVDLGWLIVLASVFTAYPMLESVKLMKYISPFTLILTVNLEPVYGIIFAFFIFEESEQMSPAFYIASLVMILSIVVNGIIKSKRKKELKTEAEL